MKGTENIKIPPRQKQIDDKNRRFYVMAPSSVKLALEKEAFNRGTDLWTLGGQVLCQWIAAGFPDQIVSRDLETPEE